jgi:hypothetical protein
MIEEYTPMSPETSETHTIDNLLLLSVIPGKYGCKWSHCLYTFDDEKSLWPHLMEHLEEEEIGDCKWNGCPRSFRHKYTFFIPNVYRGHITDHLISHMSKQFYSYSCNACQELFRNRQKLFRHKKTCVRYRAQSPESNPSTEGEAEESEEEVGGLDVSSTMQGFLKVNSLDIIIAEEIQDKVVCKHSSHAGVGELCVKSLEDAIADELLGKLSLPFFLTVRSR